MMHRLPASRVLVALDEWEVDDPQEPQRVLGHPAEPLSQPNTEPRENLGGAGPRLGQEHDQITLAESGLLEPDALRAWSEEAEEWSDEPPTRAERKVLEGELYELRSYAELAGRIRVNAKGEARLTPSEGRAHAAR
jgi:hypothetical protein